MLIKHLSVARQHIGLNLMNVYPHISPKRNGNGRKMAGYRIVKGFESKKAERVRGNAFVWRN